MLQEVMAESVKQRGKLQGSNHGGAVARDDGTREREKRRAHAVKDESMLVTQKRDKSAGKDRKEKKRKKGARESGDAQAMNEEREARKERKSKSTSRKSKRDLEKE